MAISPKNACGAQNTSVWGESPPQAKIFGILNPLNVDFPMGKGTAGGEILGQIWPQTQKPPPLVKKQIDSKGGGLLLELPLMASVKILVLLKIRCH